MPAIISKAPGKTILFGEHAVVYGFPAIAVPIDAVQVKVTLLPVIKGSHSVIKLLSPQWNEEIVYENLEANNPIKAAIDLAGTFLGIQIPLFDMTISSTIPVAAGLGSSAALAVAVTRGISQFVGAKISDNDINLIAFETEKIQHGSPSGIDNSVITFQEPIYFRKNEPIRRIKIAEPLSLILGDTGNRTLTKDVVTQVRNEFSKIPETIQPIFETIGLITENALIALSDGDNDQVGKLMTENHQELKKLNVSSDELDRLVESAMTNGALGAKLCGGGQGGFMVALCTPVSIDKVNAGLLLDGATNVISTRIAEDNSRN